VVAVISGPLATRGEVAPEEAPAPDELPDFVLSVRPPVRRPVFPAAAACFAAAKAAGFGT